MASLLIPVLLASCTAPSYKLASDKTPPPVMYNLPSTEPPFEVLVHTVIVFHGAGSWKQNAWWDEYIVTIANRGDGLITIDSAALTDFQDEIAAAGTDPWELEAASRSLARRGYGAASDAVVQIGGGVTGVAVGGGIGAVLLAGGYAGTAGGVAVGAILALPAAVSGSIYTNVKSHNSIEREFARRRLVLPIVLLPGELVKGSLFFRVAPGPKHLTLQCRVDETPREVVVDLSPLRGLHLKSPPAGERVASQR